MLNQQIQLPDGRRLGYDDRGPAGGMPLLYFHGSPSSRLESYLFVSDELLQRLNVRMIVPDRPGMGTSEYQQNRRILDWPADVLNLVEHLKIERFSILAYSLGGPYGMACAYALPDRLSKVGIVSGAALFTESKLIEAVNPGTRRFLSLPGEHPWLSRLFLGIMLRIMPHIAPNTFIRNAASMLPPPDRTLVAADRAFQQGFLHMIREALRQGTRGAHQEALLTVTGWGFELQQIQAALRLWHGDADQNIPVEMARHLAAAVPGCRAEFYPNEGHLSLFKKYAEHIFGELIDPDI